MTKSYLPLLLALGGAPAFAQTAVSPQAQTQAQSQTQATDQGQTAQTPTTGQTQADDQKRQAIVDQEVAQLASKIGLNATETTQFKETFDKYGAQIKPLWQDARQSRDALKQELEAAQPNAAKLTQLSDKLESDHQQIQALETQKVEDLKRQLNPTQFAQFLVNRPEMFRDIHRRMQEELKGTGESGGDQSVP